MYTFTRHQGLISTPTPVGGTHAYAQRFSVQPFQVMRVGTPLRDTGTDTNTPMVVTTPTSSSSSGSAASGSAAFVADDDEPQCVMTVSKTSPTIYLPQNCTRAQLQTFLSLQDCSHVRRATLLRGHGACLCRVHATAPPHEWLDATDLMELLPRVRSITTLRAHPMTPSQEAISGSYHFDTSKFPSVRLDLATLCTNVLPAPRPDLVLEFINEHAHVSAAHRHNRVLVRALGNYCSYQKPLDSLWCSVTFTGSFSDKAQFAVNVVGVGVNRALHITEEIPLDADIMSQYARVAAECFALTSEQHPVTTSFIHTWTTASHICLAHDFVTTALAVIVASMKALPPVSPRLTLLQLRLVPHEGDIPNAVRKGVELLLTSWLGRQHEHPTPVRRLVLQLRDPVQRPAKSKSMTGILAYLEILLLIFSDIRRVVPVGARSLFVIVSVPSATDAWMVRHVLGPSHGKLPGHWFVAEDRTGSLSMGSLAERMQPVTDK